MTRAIEDRDAQIFDVNFFRFGQCLEIVGRRSIYIDHTASRRAASNLVHVSIGASQDSIALGLGQRFEDVENAYAAANQLLGRLVKVTPSSKAVGDLALQLVGSGVSSEDFASDPGKYDLPDSVIGFLRGELGDPPGGWPEPFRTAALAGRPPAMPTPPPPPPCPPPARPARLRP